MTAPRQRRTSAGTINVTANATDNDAVVGVQFMLDGANLGAEDTTAPYSIVWDTTTAPNGPHTLTAVARDLSSEHCDLRRRCSVTVSNTGAAAGRRGRLRLRHRQRHGGHGRVGQRATTAR